MWVFQVPGHRRTAVSYGCALGVRGAPCERLLRGRLGLPRAVVAEPGADKYNELAYDGDESQLVLLPVGRRAVLEALGRGMAPDRGGLGQGGSSINNARSCRSSKHNNDRHGNSKWGLPGGVPIGGAVHRSAGGSAAGSGKLARLSRRLPARSGVPVSPDSWKNLPPVAP